MTAHVATVSTLRSKEGHAEVHEQIRLWIAFLALGAALIVQQFVTIGKVKRALLERAPLDPVNDLGHKAWTLMLASWRSFTSPADLAIAAVILLSAAYVVWAEVRHGAVTALLYRADDSRRVLFGFLGLATVIAARGYLTPGQVFMGDAETHMLRSWMYAEQLRHLQTPVWSNAWYGGFPLLANYGPLYFIVTAILTIVLGDIHLATK